MSARYAPLTPWPAQVSRPPQVPGKAMRRAAIAWQRGGGHPTFAGPLSLRSATYILTRSAPFFLASLLKSCSRFRGRERRSCYALPPPRERGRGRNTLTLGGPKTGTSHLVASEASFAAAGVVQASRSDHGVSPVMARQAAGRGVRNAVQSSRSGETAQSAAACVVSCKREPSWSCQHHSSMGQVEM